MVWFKVDDNLAFHAKVVAAGNPAMGLWVRAGSWCALQLTDGFIPDHMLAALGTKQQAERLVAQRLWDREQGGYRFHEWVERQPSKGDVEAERVAARNRMKAYRAKKKGVEQTPSSQVSDMRSPEPTENFGGSSGEVRDVFGNPDPAQPDPVPVPNKRVGRGKPLTTFPDDFEPNDNNRQVAEKQGVLHVLDEVIENWADHHRAKGSKFRDWNLSLNTWLRNEKPRAPLPRPRVLPQARDIEQPPDGLSPAEYHAWDLEQRTRRHA